MDDCEFDCCHGAALADAENCCVSTCGMEAGPDRCGVLGRDIETFLPWMFAVGGTNTGSVLFEVFEPGPPELVFRDVAAPVFDLGGAPPYFSRSSWVVLYLVAVLSLSIVVSLCFCNVSKCA